MVVIKDGKPEQPQLVFTVGHSTRKLDAFVGLLQAHSVSRVVDVRTIPRSRHKPAMQQREFAESPEEGKNPLSPHAHVA